ncbi:potassium channel family protein [Luteibacter aegosomatissinici]|uniref:potassium channel family protein n=1 Tax=Luteibacter aegosomatissinici TaxID=2911539 RepID=UPI001FF758EB|nr:potassium channel family protein [Luteibacter aegosomatissinici]UPG96585.1 potassium channel family protein [Luteibacter aegosomatissinici]
MTYQKIKSRASEFARFHRPLLLAVGACTVANIVASYGWPFSSAEAPAEWGVSVLIIVTSVAYLWIARLIPQSLVIREHELYGSVLLYVAIAMLIILQCAGFGWAPYDLFGPTAASGVRPTRGDAIYFSAVTFTTLGYGDFAPSAGPGRALAIFEAMLGTAHSVFFVLVFLRGGTISEQSDGHEG